MRGAGNLKEQFLRLRSSGLYFLKTFAFRSLESIFAVFLALVFFGLFLGLLNLIFPSGSDLMKEAEKGGFLSNVSFPADSVRNLVLNSGGEELKFDGDNAPAAFISAKRNKVKGKRADQIFWRKAEKGFFLYDRDAVQTHRRSSATIQLDKGNFLELGENSLIIIRRLQDDPILKERRSLLVMFEGELSGRISPTEEKGVFFEVAMKDSVATIRSRDLGEGPTDFKIKIEADQTAVITVFNGEAEVTAQGKTMELRGNQGTMVKPGQAPFVPEPLPPPPSLREPGPKEKFFFRDLPPNIRFTWKGQTSSNTYRLFLSKDQTFKEILLNETVEETRFHHGNLKAGSYYWKVSTVKDKKEGLASKVGSFTLTQKKTPPVLDVTFPPDTVKDAAFDLTGSTDPGALIRIGGEDVPTDPSGNFFYPITFQSGINIVVVEAVDPAGNVSYQSKLVNGKF